MNSSEVGALLRCSERTVEDHARAGRLPAVKFGDGWIFPTEALLRAVNLLAEQEAKKRSRPTDESAVSFPVKSKRTRPDLASF
jgi:excisionase family DNA binding protein